MGAKMSRPQFYWEWRGPSFSIKDNLPESLVELCVLPFVLTILLVLSPLIVFVSVKIRWE